MIYALKDNKLLFGDPLYIYIRLRGGPDSQLLWTSRCGDCLTASMGSLGMHLAMHVLFAMTRPRLPHVVEPAFAREEYVASMGLRKFIKSECGLERWRLPRFHVEHEPGSLSPPLRHVPYYATARAPW